MHSETMISRCIARLGPMEITETTAYSFVVSVLLIVGAAFIRCSLWRGPTRWSIAAESLVEHLEAVMRDMSGRDPRPYMPLVVTLALFIGVANLLGLVPGLRSPTADFSTTAALATIVFLAVPYYGIRLHGVRGYLRHYLEPTPILLPLEIITELSRTLSLAVRLFGNVMSDELVIAVLLTIAGLLIPVPLMMLAVLLGLVQAYIFSVLTMVYLSAAVRSGKAMKG